MTALTLPRPRRIRPLAMLVAAVGLVAATQLGAVVQAPPARPAQPIVVSGPVTPPGAPVSATPADLGRIDKAIATWTANLTRNDKDFISAATLGMLYESRARLSGDITDYTRAAEAATRSLAIEPRQLDVQALHARLLLATHDFAKALTEARAIDRAAPDQPAVLSIIADASLELGDIDLAAAQYARIEKIAPGAAVTARLARLSFLRGDPGGAVTQAEAAYAAADAEGQTGPALSWYGYLAGTLTLAAGSPETAAGWFDKALAAWPGSYLALAGRARASAAIGDTARAIAGYRAAIAVAPQPDALTALGDLLALGGDTAGADDQYATVLAIARLQGGDGLVYNRQLVLFDVNHGRDLATALTLAEQELAERHDAYGYDAYAWALLANGRAAEADAAMAKALAVGTHDALLLYHSAEIKLALGDHAAARQLLGDALAITGALDPLAAAKATATLAGLR
jgi:tetratricopeptide (TPR) repeat protein